MAANPDRPRSVINSALWAAAGDAVGWLTELSTPDGVRRRTGDTEVKGPVEWDRLVGGRFGVRAHLPAGTYSDDTQLRLAVSRAIRGNGVFDPEVFAKVELPVWLSYALGAGRGSKAAAANLIKRDSNWFSNFYNSKDQVYVRGGGNGAAMRVQPFAWRGAAPHAGEWLADVVRCAVVTHGHVHGVAGAVFHAAALKDVLDTGKIAGPSDWFKFVSEVKKIPSILEDDRQLGAFWLPAWESETGHSVELAVREVVVELSADIEKFGGAQERRREQYTNFLHEIGCFTPSLRGSGLKTALAASALCWLSAEDGPEHVVLQAANAIGSDTDTIGTMAGAIAGAVADREPEWDIQDREYIKEEASRLAKIAPDRRIDSFGYPDLSKWVPPSSQLDAVGTLPDGGLALAGIGSLRPVFDPLQSANGHWQWMALPFGQTIFVKRREQPKRLHKDSLPANRLVHSAQQRTGVGMSRGDVGQPVLPLGGDERRPSARTEPRVHVPQRYFGAGAPRVQPDRQPSIDELTDMAIRSGFNPDIVGRLLMDLIDSTQSTDLAVGFAAILAKARVARMKNR